MPILRTIHDPGTLDRLVARVGSLRPDSPGRWGRMTAHGAMCHMSDLFRAALGERDVDPRGGWLQHGPVKWWALTVPLQWPHGFPTARQFDQERDGTPPAVFEADREALIALMRRFSDPGAPLGTHILFGPLTRAEWGRWGFRHTDHHLRQFGA